MFTYRDISARIFAAAATVSLGVVSATSAQAQPAHISSSAPRTVTASGTINILHSFAGADGSNPQGGLQYAISTTGSVPSAIFGTTQSGGANNAGVLFAQSTATGSAFKDAFDFTGTSGAGPAGGLGGVIGNYTINGPFFGVTNSGGKYGLGAIYEATANGAQTVLYSFTGRGDGANPLGRLVFFKGRFFGTTSAGAKGYGTVFSYSAEHGLTTLHKFTGGNDGGSPSAGLSLRLTIPSDDLKARKAALVGRSIDAQRADWSFVDSYLYGTTSGGGAGGLGTGTLFKIAPNGSFKTLYTFADTVAAPGANPAAELATDFNGNLYGSTSNGGSAGVGELFEYTAQGKFGVIHDFAVDPDSGAATTGANPLAPLTVAFNGVLYGTTSSGSLYGNGNVFSLGATGFILKYEFAGPDGASPQGNLVDGLDGNLYGTTFNGGANGLGEVFAIAE